MNEKSKSLPGDNPIRDQEDDTLERTVVAYAFAQRVLDLDASEGAAVGVFGPWGSGKTSFVNLARQTFESEGVPVLDFNPWLFSGAEQLVKRFIVELSTELKLRDLEAIGKALEGYGDALSGLSGKNGIVDWIVALGVAGLGATASGGTLAGLTGEFGIEEVVVAAAVGLILLLRETMKAVGKVLQGRQGGISSRRKKVTSTLRNRDKPIVVVLDDVDRLAAAEIREVFKLVRLTASFPNVIIRTAPTDELAEERDPLRVLVFAKHYGWPTEEPFEIDASSKLTFALLRSTRWEAATASSGALTVVLSPALGPETLIDLYGGEEVLKTRINDLKTGFDTLKPWIKSRQIRLDDAEQLLVLADRYLSGSRPDAD